MSVDEAIKRNRRYKTVTIWLQSWNKIVIFTIESAENDEQADKPEEDSGTKEIQAGNWWDS